MQPPLDFTPCRVLLRHRPKSRSLALSSLDYLLVDQQEAHWMPSAPIGNQLLLLPPEKLDSPVWHFKLSGFPALKLLCPADGQRVHSGHLTCSSLHDQNPE
jgi:hypothetical protein